MNNTKIIFLLLIIVTLHYSCKTKSEVIEERLKEFQEKMDIDSTNFVPKDSLIITD